MKNNRGNYRTRTTSNLGGGVELLGLLILLASIIYFVLGMSLSAVN